MKQEKSTILGLRFMSMLCNLSNSSMIYKCTTLLGILIAHWTWLETLKINLHYLHMKLEWYLTQLKIKRWKGRKILVKVILDKNHWCIKFLRKKQTKEIKVITMAISIKFSLRNIYHMCKYPQSKKIICRINKVLNWITSGLVKQWHQERLVTLEIKNKSTTKIS